MRFSLLSALVLACLLAPVAANAEGLLYQLPEDGSWVRFDAPYTFKFDGMDKPDQGTGTMTMASVGKVLEGGQPCRWIEFNVHLKDSGTEHTLIRKLLIPEKYLKKGENPTQHVVRGWAKYDNEDVERAVPLHGRWPAYLAGPFQDEKQLDKQLVEGKLGSLECAGSTGWIQFSEGPLTSKVTFETRLHDKAPFGVLSTRMKFEMSVDGKPQGSIDAAATLTDLGTDAKSALPDHN
jgi:hypothetical protein